MEQITDKETSSAPGFTYINRSKHLYHLHSKKTKTGKLTFFMSRTPRPDPISNLPEDFEVYEDLNGGVFIRKKTQSAIPAADVELVRQKVESLKRLAHYKVELKKDAITIHQPFGIQAAEMVMESDYSAIAWLEQITKTSGLKGLTNVLESTAQKMGMSLSELRAFDATAASQKKADAVEKMMQNLQYSPVLRFVFDKVTGLYFAERIDSRMEGGWYPLAQSKLATLVNRYVKHIGKESFYDLI